MNNVRFGSWLGVTLSCLLSTNGFAAAPQCDGVQSTPIDIFSSPLDLESRMTKIWLLCGQVGEDPFPLGMTHEGLEITQDGRVYSLATNAAGELVRRTGFDSEFDARAVEAIGLGNYHVSMSNAEKDFTFEAAFSNSGETMRLPYMTSASIYQATDRQVVVPRTEHVGERLGEAGCRQREAGVRAHATSADDLRALIVGKWHDCRMPLPDDYKPMTPEGFAGIEFFTDGSWSYLGAPSDQPSASGQYAVEKFEDSYSITLFHANGERSLLSFAFSEAPIKMMLAGGHMSNRTYYRKKAVFSAMP